MLLCKSDYSSNTRISSIGPHPHLFPEAGESVTVPIAEGGSVKVWREEGRFCIEVSRPVDGKEIVLFAEYWKWSNLTNNWVRVPQSDALDNSGNV